MTYAVLLGTTLHGTAQYISITFHWLASFPQAIRRCSGTTAHPALSSYRVLL